MESAYRLDRDHYSSLIEEVGQNVWTYPGGE